MREIPKPKIIAKIIVFTLLGLSLALVQGCQEPSAREFKLPQGDEARGQVAFLDLGCTSCHEVSQVPLERPYADEQIYVYLGGSTTRVKSYSDLITAIINPSHRLSRGNDPRTVNADGSSKMPNYNSVMQIQQLIDLVAFLQPRYQLYIPPNWLGDGALEDDSPLAGLLTRSTRQDRLSVQELKTPVY